MSMSPSSSDEVELGARETPSRSEAFRIVAAAFARCR